MKRAGLIVCTLLTLGLANIVFAKELTPKQVMQGIRQAYNQVQSLRATVQLKMGETFVASVRFLRPKQFVVQVTQNGKLIQSFTSDGTTLTRYDARNKTYTQEPVAGDKPLAGEYLAFMGFFAGLAVEPQFGQTLEGFVQQSFEKAQAKDTQKVGATPCRVVELTGEGGTMILFLGQKDGLVYRIVYKMPSGNTYEELVTSLQLNPRIERTAFAFKPPADAKKAELPKASQREEDDTTSLKGQEAPNFTLIDMEGTEVSLSSLRGKVVFLDFWATWCPPCRESLPHTQALSQHEKAKSGDLVVLAVNVGEEIYVVKKFMQEKGFTFRVLMDKKGATANTYKVRGIPTFVIIDREGKVAWVKAGFGPGIEKQMEEAVHQVLGP